MARADVQRETSGATPIGTPGMEDMDWRQYLLVAVFVRSVFLQL